MVADKPPWLTLCCSAALLLTPQAAISMLCQLLRVHPRAFGVGGTKDRRGVTVQRATAFRIAPARLAGLNPRLRGLRLGNFEFAEEQMRLGDLQGNR